MIYGYSQGAMIANLEKRKLAEQYPVGSEAPDIDFVLRGDPNLPNGGLPARFPGLSFRSGFVVQRPCAYRHRVRYGRINRQYDGVADFPLYPLNVIATA